MNFFDQVLSRKRHDDAIFLGCGQSINCLDDNDIQKIQEKFDVWVSNNFMIHKTIVPDFYHLEVKPHRNGPLVHRLTREKKEAYGETKWLLDSTRPYILDYMYYDENTDVSLYKKWYRKENHGRYNPDPNQVSVSVNASITVISDVMCRMGYNTIYFLGVDMGSSRYFWTDNFEYDRVEIEDIIKTTKPDERSPDSPHPTAHMASYLPEFFSFNDQRVVNLSRDSLLRSTMETIGVREIL